MIFNFLVPGIPVAKQRARTLKNGHSYTPDKTARYENLVRLFFNQSKPNNWKRLDCPITVKIRAVFPMPQSASKSDKVIGSKLKSTKPDLDNVIKSVLDGLNGVAWVDDSRICKIEAAKIESITDPHLNVFICWEE